MQVIERNEESKICPICGNACGFQKWGRYYRYRIEFEKKELIPVTRKMCRIDGKKGKTFSCLPEDLIPYHQYSLKFLWHIIYIFVTSGAKTKSGKLEELIDEYESGIPVVNFYLSHIRSFMNVLEKARERLRMGINKIFETFQEFLEYSKRVGIIKQNREYFEIKGRYLFGIASQHRRRLSFSG